MTISQRVSIGILAVMLIGILFPFGWLGEYWALFGTGLGAVFETSISHAMGHASLFFLLGLTALLALRGLQARPCFYGGLMIAAAFAQEFVQLAYKQRPLQWDDPRDIATDLLGAVAAFMLVADWRRLNYRFNTH